MFSSKTQPDDKKMSTGPVEDGRSYLWVRTQVCLLNFSNLWTSKEDSMDGFPWLDVLQALSGSLTVLFLPHVWRDGPELLNPGLFPSEPVFLLVGAGPSSSCSSDFKQTLCDVIKSGPLCQQEPASCCVVSSVTESSNTWRGWNIYHTVLTDVHSCAVL